MVGPYVDRITKVPATYVDQAADVFMRIAERNGGHMMGKRLTATVRNATVGDDTATFTVAGTPAGPWAMRESGVRPHTIAPEGRGALAGGLSHPVTVPVRHPGFAGEHRWTHTTEQAGPELARLASVLADKAAA